MAKDIMTRTDQRNRAGTSLLKSIACVINFFQFFARSPKSEEGSLSFIHCGLYFVSKSNHHIH